MPPTPALLIPEDKPPEMCLQTLPRHTHERPLSPRSRAEMLARLAEASKKKGKGKGKGRSKSPRKKK